MNWVVGATQTSASNIQIDHLIPLSVSLYAVVPSEGHIDNHNRKHGNLGLVLGLPLNARHLRTI